MASAWAPSARAASMIGSRAAIAVCGSRSFSASATLIQRALRGAAKRLSAIVRDAQSKKRVRRGDFITAFRTFTGTGVP